MMCIDSYHLSLLKHPCKKDQTIRPLSCQKGVWAGEEEDREQGERGLFVFFFFLSTAKINIAIFTLVK